MKIPPTDSLYRFWSTKFESKKYIHFTFAMYLLKSSCTYYLKVPTYKAFKEITTH